MPLAKLTCPHCRTTLKPAKPVPEGKTVKCPKCGETFKAGETETGSRPAARTKSDAAAKKPTAAAAASKAAPDDDDDGGAIYGVVKDEAEERRKAEVEERRRRRKRRKLARGEDGEDDEDEDEEDKDDLTAHLLKSLKSKDPRGPAQETVVRPANWLLRTALLGFFGWVFYFIAFMLPVAFPTYEKKEDAYSQMAKEIDAKEKTNAKDKKESKEIIHWWSAESILHGGDPQRPDTVAWSVVLFLFVLMLGVVQSAIIAAASMKMQSLESYKWAVWGCILAIIPLMMVPWWVLLTATFDLLDSVFEFGETAWMYAAVLFLWGPMVGGLCLSKVLQKHVRPGFEYKPD
jgi:predicted Zn finger-like uncharacterized protein